jgi:branched-chain amino acid transport system substrate-binding protein
VGRQINLKYHVERRRRGLSRLSILLLLVLGACASSEQHADLANDIPIAVAGPMSGDLAEFGTQMREAAKLAVADNNAAGGVLGKPLRLFIQDDECDPERAREGAWKIAEQHVVAVVGHFCSGTSIPASGVYADNGILQITPVSSNPLLTEQAAIEGWHTVFRTCARDDYQGIVAADYLAAHFGHSRVAVLWDDSVYGATVAKPLLRGLVGHEIKPVYQGMIMAGRSSYQGMIDALIEARPDVVYFSGYSSEAALLVSEARASKLRAIFLGSNVLMTRDFLNRAGPAAEGVLLTGSPDPGRIPAASDLIRRLQERGYEAISTSDLAYTAVQTYAAFQEFALAAERAGTIDAEAVAAALRKGRFETIIGSVAFDEKGDLREQVYVWYYFRNRNLQRWDD